MSDSDIQEDGSIDVADTDGEGADGAEETTLAGKAGAGAIQGTYGLFDTVSRATRMTVVTWYTSLGKFTPLGERIGKGLFKTGIKIYYKASGGDAVALNCLGNRQIEPRAVKWTEPSQKDDDEVPDEPAWHAKGKDQRWHPGRLGSGTERVGNVPVILAHDDDRHQFTPYESRIAEAIDLGKFDVLYTNPTFEVNATLDATAGAGTGEAVADGGVADMQRSLEYTIEQAARGDLEDALIDVGSGEGLDGMRVSFEKVQEMDDEKATTDDMRRQEQRGYLAGKDADHKKLALKLMLIAAGIIALVILGPTLVRGLFGMSGGGGGGGSVLPMFLTGMGVL